MFYIFSIRIQRGKWKYFILLWQRGITEPHLLGKTNSVIYFASKTAVFNVNVRLWNSQMFLH